MNHAVNRRALIGIVVLLAAGLVYFYQLGSLHIPKNGDEYPYTHIVRETAMSGHFLPLKDRIDLNNTKPPLLFWQGILATNWAESWSLWRLRAPSVFYTLLTSLLIFRITWVLSSSARSALLAALSYLAFFSTYHYGRPFLTDSGLVFWTTLAVSLCVRKNGITRCPDWGFVTLAGLSLGIAALYKSLAFVVPVAGGLFLLFWMAGRQESTTPRDSILRLMSRMLLMVVLSGLVFSLWFALDPNPRQVFESFVLRENFGKFEGQSSYFKDMFVGKQTLWSVIFGIVVNAGLLAPAVLALIVLTVRHRRELPAVEKGLWILIVVSIVFFILPGQRSGRYLLHVMPLVAVLLGLSWSRLPNWVFGASAIVVAIMQILLAYLAFRWKSIFGETASLPVWFWLGGLCGISLLLFCVARPGFLKAGLLGLILLIYVQGSGLFAPLSGSLGLYPDTAVREVNGKSVWVPENFRAKHERYRFILPGSEPVGYAPHTAPWSRQETTPRQCRYLAIQPGRNEQLPASAAVLGLRWDVATRHTSAEIREMVFGNRLDLLFQQEFLLDLGDWHPGEAPRPIDSRGASNGKTGSDPLP